MAVKPLKSPITTVTHRREAGGKLQPPTKSGQGTLKEGGEDPEQDWLSTGAFGGGLEQEGSGKGEDKGENEGQAFLWVSCRNVALV